MPISTQLTLNLVSCLSWPPLFLGCFSTLSVSWPWLTLEPVSLNRVLHGLSPIFSDGEFLKRIDVEISNLLIMQIILINILTLHSQISTNVTRETEDVRISVSTTPEGSLANVKMGTPQKTRASPAMVCLPVLSTHTSL